MKITFFWSFFLNLTLNHYTCPSWIEGIKYSRTKVSWIIIHLIHSIVSFKVSTDTKAQTYALTAEISTKIFFNILRKICSHKKMFWCNVFGSKMYKNIYKLFRKHAVSIFVSASIKAQLEYGGYVLFCFEDTQNFFSDGQRALNKRNDNEKLSSQIWYNLSVEI